MLEKNRRLAELIAETLDLRGISRAEIARAANVTPQAVNGWLNTGRIGKDKLQIIARVLGLSLDQLLDASAPEPLRTGESTATYNITSGPDIARSVPLISWVQAGQWADVVDNLAPGQAEKRIFTTIRAGPRTYALRVLGDSMTNPTGSPSFPEGTIIILDPDRTPISGSYVIVRQNGDSECTFKQLVRDGGDMYLKPLNPRYPILQMLPDATVCGVLIQAMMDF